MATRKRGPLKIDLTGLDGVSKIDAELCPTTNQYVVRIGRDVYHWSATKFAELFRKWLVRQSSRLHARGIHSR